MQTLGSIFRTAASALILWMAAGLAASAAAPRPETLTAFDSYARSVEARLARAPATPPASALNLDARQRAELRAGASPIECLAETDLPGGMLHHWRGAAFVPGAAAADFERVLRDVADYPHYFAPQVLRAGVTAGRGDNLQIWMRVRQHHGLTVVLDTSYRVQFVSIDALHGHSTSRSTRITEVADAGTRDERALGADQDHGFLWRQNTYWSYEQADGGLYLEVETLSLTRAIPRGLGWAIRPYIESIPRESLEFTLRSVAAALRK